MMDITEKAPGNGALEEVQWTPASGSSTAEEEKDERSSAATSTKSSRDQSNARLFIWLFDTTITRTEQSNDVDALEMSQYISDYRHDDGRASVEEPAASEASSRPVSAPETESRFSISRSVDIHPPPAGHDHQPMATRDFRDPEEQARISVR